MPRLAQGDPLQFSATMAAFTVSIGDLISFNFTTAKNISIGNLLPGSVLI